jgi:oligopeptide/dipeptide ABC transporter ATP-binding protein
MTALHALPGFVDHDGAAKADPLLEISGLTVEFPQFGTRSRPVLIDIDFTIARGEVVGLVGESGSGKTTLARSIMQLVPEPGFISSGKLFFEGRDLAGLDAETLRQLRGREIAMIISNPRGELDPLQTVGQQIGNVLRAHTSLDAAGIRARVLELLRQVSIPAPERRVNAYPHELSGGMAQRVVMAIALACSPKLLVSDDATSGLDVTVQAQVLELMRELVSGFGTSMLFITRDIGITAHYCDRVAVIYAGEIVEEAPRDEFFANPHHPYSILLLSAFAQNERLRRYWLGDTAAAAKSELQAAAVGCPFAGRCVRAQSRCRAEAPERRELGQRHFVKCHYPVER